MSCPRCLRRPYPVQPFWVFGLADERAGFGEHGNPAQVGRIVSNNDDVPLCSASKLGRPVPSPVEADCRLSHGPLPLPHPGTARRWREQHRKSGPIPLAIVWWNPTHGHAEPVPLRYAFGGGGIDTLAVTARRVLLRVRIAELLELLDGQGKLSSLPCRTPSPALPKRGRTPSPDPPALQNARSRPVREERDELACE